MQHLSPLPDPSTRELTINTEGYAFVIHNIDFLGPRIDDNVSPALAAMIADGLVDPQPPYTPFSVTQLRHIPPYIVSELALGRGLGEAKGARVLSRSISAQATLGYSKTTVINSATMGVSNRAGMNHESKAKVQGQGQGQLYRYLTQIPKAPIMAPTSTTSTGKENVTSTAATTVKLAKELLTPQCPQTFAVKCKYSQALFFHFVLYCHYDEL